MLIETFKIKDLSIDKNSHWRIGVVASEYHFDIVAKLLLGVNVGLEKLGKAKEYDLFKVPGAFEIPLMCKKIINKYDALITLGVVIKGDTDHYKYVCQKCADGIMQVQLESGKPIIFEVLMVKKIEDAVKRADIENFNYNKGFEALMSAYRILTSIKRAIK